MKALKFFSIALATVFVLVIFAEKSFAANAVNWAKNTITVTGMGFAPAGNYLPAHAKQLAKRAAISDAYRQLAEAVNGVKVTGETTVNAMILVSDIVKTKVEASIKGVQPVSEREISGGYEVTLEMPLFGTSNSLAGVVLERPAEIIPFPEPVMNVAPTIPAYTSTTPISERIEIVVSGASSVTVETKSVYAENLIPMSNINISSLPKLNEPQIVNPAPQIQQPTLPQVTLPEVKLPTPQVPTAPKVETVKPVDKNKSEPVSNVKAAGNYTGLIVDCRNLDLQPVMSPTIQTDSNETIYGNKNLDYDKIIEYGMVSYVADINDSVAERAGKNPIVVKAASLKNFNSNPVISTADSNRILIENKSSKFLDNMNVVFLM